MAFVDRGTKDIVAFLRSVRDYLVAGGIGVVPDPTASPMVQGTIFLQQMPEKPQIATVISATGGVVLPQDPTRRPSFQIQHRNSSAGAGLSKAVEINNLLNDQWNVLTGFAGRIVALTEAPGVPFKDDSGNLIISLNFVLITTCQA